MKTITDGSAKFVVRDKRMQALVDMFYPVGTIYETTSSTKPEFMNYGTWEQLPGGYTTVSAGTYTETHNVNGTDVTDTYVFTAGKTTFTRNGTEMSGEAEHQSTEGELAAHRHGVYKDDSFAAMRNPNGDSWKQALVNPIYPDAESGTAVAKAGGNLPHNNIMPIFITYRFIRII